MGVRGAGVRAPLSETRPRRERVGENVDTLKAAADLPSREASHSPSHGQHESSNFPTS